MCKIRTIEGILVGEVVNMAEKRPHFTAYTPAGVVVLPVEMIKRLARGDLCISECDNPPAVTTALARISLDLLDEPY